MTKQAQSIYEFGIFRVDAAKRLLLRDGEVVPLTPKCFDILLALVETSGEVIGKDVLINRIWPDSFVEEGNLTYNISMLRKALGEKASEHQYIVTIPGRGYQFSASVRELSDEATARPADLAGELASEPEAQTADERTAAPRIYSVRQRGVILAGFAGLLLISAAIYFSTARKSEQLQSGLAIRSLGVLPFKPLVAERRDEALELGMADALINKLSSIKEIIVLPISAVRKYSALNQDPLAAGRELGVDAVLDASIQWEGENKIRVTARLLSVRDGSTIWTDKCDEQCNNVFELQDSIADRVARVLSPHLTGGERGLLAKRYTESVEAYQLYLKGRFFWNKRTGGWLNKSIEYFNQAIEKDPSFALAYAGLANCYLAPVNPLPPREKGPKAKAAAMRALELDETLAEAHTSLAHVSAIYTWDWPAAEREFKRAIELNPRYAIAHQWYGGYLEVMGRHNEALAEKKLAQELDPLSLTINFELGLGFYFARDYHQAIEHFQKTIELEPNFQPPHAFLIAAYGQEGMYDKAIAGFKNALNLQGGDERPGQMAALGHVYAVSGRKDEAQAVLNRLKQLSAQPDVSAYPIALVYAGLGEKDHAFTWLEKAYEERAFPMRSLKMDPRWDSLRSDPRFADLVRRIGLPL